MTIKERQKRQEEKNRNELKILAKVSPVASILYTSIFGDMKEALVQLFDDAREKPTDNRTNNFHSIRQLICILKPFFSLIRINQKHTSKFKNTKVQIIIIKKIPKAIEQYRVHIKFDITTKSRSKSSVYDIHNNSSSSNISPRIISTWICVHKCTHLSEACTKREEKLHRQKQRHQEKFELFCMGLGSTFANILTKRQ